jgi:hypothetical protein
MAKVLERPSFVVLVLAATGVGTEVAASLPKEATVPTAGAKKTRATCCEKPPSKYLADDDELRNDKTPHKHSCHLFPAEFGQDLLIARPTPTPLPPPPSSLGVGCCLRVAVNYAHEDGMGPAGPVAASLSTLEGST